MAGVNRKSKLSVSAPVRAALRGGSSTLPPLCLPPSYSSIQSHVPTWAPISSPLGCLPLHASRPEAPGTSLQKHTITGIAAPGNWDREESMSGVRGWGGKKKKLKRTDWCSGSPRQHGRAQNCHEKVSLFCGHVFNWWDVRISETIPKSSQLNDSLIVTEHCCLAGSLSLALFWSVLSLSPPVLPSVPGPLKNSSHSSALKACNKTEQREWDIDALFQNLANRLPRQHVKAS